MPSRSRTHEVLRTRSAVVAVAISVLLAIVYLIWAPPTLDLSAQTFRADLWSSDGFVIWSPDWYEGFTVPGYSLFYPPLGALLGPVLVGALSAVAATALFAAVATRAFDERASMGVLAFALASAVAPFGGRTTFALGLALALACALAIQRHRPVAAAAAALAAALASPVAGLFTLLAAASVGAAAIDPWGRADRGSLPIAAASAAAVGSALGIASLALLFPTPGFQPFALSAFVWIPVIAIAALATLRHRAPILWWGAALYLALGTLALVVHTPLGGNVVRLGVTFALPLALILLAGRRPALIALVCAPLLFWQWTATVRDLAASSGDPSTSAGYYAPLLAELDGLGIDRTDRVHVSATRSRWESVYVAEQVPIDLGWLRQLEASDSSRPATPSMPEYLSWLRGRGVSLLAVPDAPPDRAAESERALLDSPRFGLEPIWSDSHWRLYDLRPDRGGADPIVVGGSARVLTLAPDRIEVRLGGSGRATLALRWTSYFSASGGDRGLACAERIETADGSPLIRVSGRPGELIRLDAKLSLGAVLGRDPCSGSG